MPDRIPAVLPRKSAQVCVRAWEGPSEAIVAMLARPTMKRERRISVPTVTASRRLGGADLVIDAADEERSTEPEGSVGKKIRKRRTLLPLR